MPDLFHIRNNCYFMPVGKFFYSQPDIPDPGSRAEVFKRSIYKKNKIEFFRGLCMPFYFRENHFAIIVLDNFSNCLESGHIGAHWREGLIIRLSYAIIFSHSASKVLPACRLRKSCQPIDSGWPAKLSEAERSLHPGTINFSPSGWSSIPFRYFCFER